MIALLAFYPLWWLLGLGVLIFPLAAVPMLVSLYRWRRAGRKILVPPGFTLWLIFCAVLIAGLAALDYEPAGAVPGAFDERILGVVFRMVQYGSLTIMLLYAGSISVSKLSQRTLVNLLGWLFVVTVLGGLLGTFAGHLEVTSPVEMLLPKGMGHSRGFIKSMVHPYAAQLHEIVGDTLPRPAAPWGYTNTWGNNYCLLVGWFVVAIYSYTKRKAARVFAVATLVVSIIPVVYSLNRGLWIGLGAAAIYLGIRQALAGKTRPLIVAGLATGVLAFGTAATPLGTLFEERLDHGKSNGVRMFLTERAIAGMEESPILGYGSTRNTMGGRQSIATGSSEECERCGNFVIGGNGQLWQVLFAHGLVGTLAYFGFFGYGLWRFRRDKSPIGLAGSAAIVGSFVAALWYNSLVTPLAFTFLSYVLLWRNNMPALPLNLASSTENKPGGSAA